MIYRFRWFQFFTRSVLFDFGLIQILLVKILIQTLLMNWIWMQTKNNFLNYVKTFQIYFYDNGDFRQQHKHYNSWRYTSKIMIKNEKSKSEVHFFNINLKFTFFDVSCRKVYRPRYKARKLRRRTTRSATKKVQRMNVKVTDEKKDSGREAQKRPPSWAPETLSGTSICLFNHGEHGSIFIYICWGCNLCSW